MSMGVILWWMNYLHSTEIEMFWGYYWFLLDDGDQSLSFPSRYTWPWTRLLMHLTHSVHSWNALYWQACISQIRVSIPIIYLHPSLETLPLPWVWTPKRGAASLLPQQEKAQLKLSWHDSTSCIWYGVFFMMRLLHQNIACCNALNNTNQNHHTPNPF